MAWNGTDWLKGSGWRRSQWDVGVVREGAWPWVEVEEEASAVGVGVARVVGVVK